MDHDPGINCHFPRAENISANLTYINGSMHINVTWDQTKRTQKAYCDLSRQWSIRVLKFSSPDLIHDRDNRLEIGPDVAFTMIKRRSTHYLVPEEVELDKYYLIQIRNGHRDPNGVKIIYRNYSSHIYYYGTQGLLFIVFLLLQ